MIAKDVMTAEVVSVRAETPVREVARQLVEHGVGAAPVLDDTGAPIGMISDGDLLGREVDARLARREWWLEILADRAGGRQDTLERLRTTNATARQVMAAPIITVGLDTPVEEIAHLLDTHRIKRVPVVDGARVVGIVSRSDLLRALLSHPPSRPARPHHLFHHAAHDEAHHDDALHAAQAPPPPSAADFHALVQRHELEKAGEANRARRDASHHIEDALKTRFIEHITDAQWRDALDKAAAAAAEGAREFLLVRFPSALCLDGGRAINALEPTWSATLTGKAADIFLRWQRELRPRGFGLGARVLEFPGGFPGDIGIFLTWKG